MSDERVERVISALEDEEDRFWDELDGSLDNIPEGEYVSYMRQHEVNKARAVLAALDEEPTLEDVLRNKGIVAIALDVGRGSDEYRAIAYRHPERWEGTGFTVDAAIRAAVANAKEQG